jgi:hypothetical protein
MGGTLGGIFSSTGQGADGAPSFLQKLVQGTAKGTLQGTGTALQKQPAPGGSGGSLPGTPSATPVDSGYFTPTALPPGAMPPGTLAARPGAGPSPFYAQ